MLAHVQVLRFIDEWRVTNREKENYLTCFCVLLAFKTSDKDLLIIEWSQLSTSTLQFLV